MKRFLHITLTVLITIALASANPSSVLASEGDDENTLEMEVNGYHVTLASQNDWKKGENTIVVTLMDSMGMPVTNAEVEILMGPKSEEHADAENVHTEPEAEPAHGAEQGHSSMPGMDMGEPAVEASDMPAHDEERANPLPLMETHEHGVYIAETHVESSGRHEVNVMFHVNGEMLQADFVVEILGALSKTIVLWGFVAVNIVLIASAGMLKRQSIPVKGRQ